MTNREALNDPRPGRSAGICAGGYFAAAAAYFANAIVMAAGRERNTATPLMLGGLTIACGLIGILVLAENRWMRKGAVVAAGAFAAIHLIGLTFLFFDASTSASPLARSLQWQLGTVFFFVWLSVLAAAIRLVRSQRICE